MATAGCKHKWKTVGHYYHGGRFYSNTLKWCEKCGTLKADIWECVNWKEKLSYKYFKPEYLKQTAGEKTDGYKGIQI